MIAMKTCFKATMTVDFLGKKTLTLLQGRPRHRSRNEPDGDMAAVLRRGRLYRK